MKILEELDLKTRQLRHTLVQGRNGKFFKVLTYQLYDATPPPEFHNFEVNVMECDARGRFRELNVPYYARFFSKEEALKHHEEVLANFDTLLQLEEAAGHKAEGAEKEEAKH